MMDQVLDECTSTFSEELAERVYWSLASHDITVVTVSHRPKHKRFHQQQLSLTGAGQWSLSATDPGIQTPPATPPVTPRAATDLPNSTSQACTGNSGRVERGSGISSSPNAEHPQATVVRRILMIMRILASRRRSTTFFLGHVSCIFLSVGLQSRILAALPGQLQALAMQSNRAAYTRLSISAFVFRFISAVSKFLSTWAGNKLSIEWEGSLTQCIIDRVMGPDSLFYKLERVDKRIDDMDTRVVADVNLLALAMQAIITSLLTPISSAVLATRLLMSANLPLVAIFTIWAFCISGVLLQKFLAPDYAGFAALTSLKQGAFRRGHQRLIASGESVAMLCGEERELETLEGLLDDVTRESQRQLYYTTRFNCVNYWFTQYLPILITNGMRMFWAMGYGSDHAIMSEANGTGISSQGLYIENLITQSFTATVGLLSMNNSFQTLVGHIVRVTDLLMVIDEIQSDAASAKPPSTAAVVADGCAGSVAGEPGQREISLVGVDIVAPDSTKLVYGLEVRLHPGDRLMVTGKGKSSLFRVLSRLWDARGVVHVPPDILKVPQQPLVTCIPVDLLTYLSYPFELAKSEQTDARTELQTSLERLGAEYLIKREGWAVRRHWVDVLSLGELQCLAVTRALFQIGYMRSPQMDTTSPQRSACSRCSWLLLDDCTSALTAEVEAQVYCQVEEVTGNGSVRGHQIGVVSFGSEERKSIGFHDRLLRLGTAMEQQPSEADRSKAGLGERCNWQLETSQRSTSRQTWLSEQPPSEFRLDEVQLGDKSTRDHS
eukprot:COSAG02_NODE_448_length_22102_cov_11.767032_16_plen_778_part_00